MATENSQIQPTFFLRIINKLVHNKQNRRYIQLNELVMKSINLFCVVNMFFLIPTLTKKKGLRIYSGSVFF